MPAQISPKQIQTPDTILGRVQAAIAEAFTFLQRQNPLLNGVLVEKRVETTDTIVNHGLGRTYLGYIAVECDSAAILFSSPTANERKESFALLRASTGANFKIYFF